MKEELAIEMLEKLEFWTQKARSNIMEALGVEDENEDSAEGHVIRDLHPWLFGPKSILIPLVNLNKRIREGQALEATEFYNFCYIVHQTPVLALSPIMLHMEWKFPEPSVKIIAQWEPKNG